MRSASARVRSGVSAMVLATLVLSGCASAPVPPPTTAAPTSAPVFASEEEALAAATEAYAAYLAMSDEIGSAGGENAKRYELVASGMALENALLSADQFRESQAHSVGSMSFSVDAIQGMNVGDDNATLVTLYVCDDVSGVEVLGAEGQSLVPSDRRDRTPFQVTLSFQSMASASLDEKSVWTGENFC